MLVLYPSSKLALNPLGPETRPETGECLIRANRHFRVLNIFFVQHSSLSVCDIANDICPETYLSVMGIHKFPSTRKYDDNHPTISFRVSQKEYDELDAIRKTEPDPEKQTWKILFLKVKRTNNRQMSEEVEVWKEKYAALDKMFRAQQANANIISLGHCTKCNRAYQLDLTNSANKKLLDDLVTKSVPLCSSCKVQVDVEPVYEMVKPESPKKESGFFSGLGKRVQ